jgi:hypothetical protein
MTKTAWIVPIALALASGCAAAADVGRVILSAGETTAVRQGQIVRLANGTMVQDADVLRTGPQSNMQVRFEDDSYVSLRENSEVRIDQFRFNGGKGDESAFFSLLKGGLRAVTGLIGRTNHENYRMDTPTATIGIRGTDFALTHCQGDCRNPDGTPANNGTYGRVVGQSNGTNQVQVTNDSGPPAVLGISSNFFVRDRGSPVQLLLVAPDFVLSKLESRNRGGSKGSSGGTGNEQASSGGAADESRPSTIPAPLPPLPFVVTQDLGPQGAPAVVSNVALGTPNGFVIAFPGKLGTFGDAFFDDNQTEGTFNSQNQLIAASGGGRTAALAGGSIVDTGSVTVGSQTFSWGRWTGATSVPLYNGSTFIQTIGVPLLFGVGTGLDTTGSAVGRVGGVATYNYIGGPHPVDGGGNVGNVTSTSMTINFTTLQQSLSLGMSFPTILVGSANMGSAIFNLSGTGTASSGSLTGEFGGGLSGSCAGGGCASSVASGNFLTGLAGPNGYDLAPVTGIVSGTKAGEVAFLNTYLVSSFTPGPVPTLLTGQLAYANLSPSIPGSVFSLPTNSTTYSGNNPVSFNTGGSSGTLAAGTIVQTGSTSLVDGGSMNWGRWSGATSITDPIAGTVSPSTGVPFVVGNANPVLPTSGTFLYTFAGGPGPVNVNGVVGTFGSGSFLVSFGSSSGSMSVATPLAMSVGGVNYSLGTCTSGCTFTNASTVAGNMVISGVCSGGACSTSAPANANAAGIFVGPQAGGLAVAGNVTSLAPTVSFAAGFKR